MKFAFCLFKYFPYGGSQLYFYRIWRECQSRGHKVHVFTREWRGDKSPGLILHEIPGRGLTHVERKRAFAAKVLAKIKAEDFDAVVGFNRMPGLDVYFAADPCFAAQWNGTKPPFWTAARRRRILNEERTVFSTSASTRVLLISEREKSHFKTHYGTEESRFTLLPPSLEPKQEIYNNYSELKERFRRELCLGFGDFLILFIASNFKLKGLDRALEAFQHLPASVRERSYLYVIGKNHPGKFRWMTRLKGMGRKIKFLGPQSDLKKFFLAGDLLLHPAYLENTGTVILQALVAGLPVLATDICGYAVHIEKSGAGKVVPSPFSQKALNDLLAEMLTSPDRGSWSKKGLEYGRKDSLYGMEKKSADVIEEAARQKTKNSALTPDRKISPY